MDFGVVGLDGLVGSENGFPPMVSKGEIRQKGLGSGCLKQGRSELLEDDCSSFKMAKADTMQMHPSSLLRSASFFQDQQHQQLLSFSSPNNGTLSASRDGLGDRSLQNGSWSYYHRSPTYGRNTDSYALSKLANVLHTKELADRLKKMEANVTVNCVNPGVVRTRLIREREGFLTALKDSSSGSLQV